MEFKKLLTDEDAVSPVIGVILMVAITVILAAVIASFVLGLGDQAQQTTPQASFSFDFTDDYEVTSGGSTTIYDQLDVTHDGGDTIAPERLSISSSTDIGAGSENSTDTDWASTLQFTHGIGQTNDVTAGTTVSVSTEATTEELNDDTVRVVYTGESGDSSSTLATWEGPNA